MQNEKGYNITSLDYLPSEFKFYNFKKLRVQDMAISQTSNLAILNGAPDLSKLIEIYAPSFVGLDIKQVNNLLYIDFIATIHLINHLTFGIYNNSFRYTCPVCGEKSKVEYNLYDIDFDKIAVSKFDGEINYTKDIKIILQPFTVELMADLINRGLDEDKDAFIASVINSVYLKGNFSEAFAKFETKLEEVKTYPYRMKEFIIAEVKKRYPEVKPLSSVLPCGHAVKFIPDMTLKGLPTFTSS